MKPTVTSNVGWQFKRKEKYLNNFKELIYLKTKNQEYLSLLFTIIVTIQLAGHIKDNKSGNTKQKTTSVCIEHPPVLKHLSVRARLLLHPDSYFEWFLLILSVSLAHPAHHPDASRQCRDSCHLPLARDWAACWLRKIALDCINDAPVLITSKHTTEYSHLYVLQQKETKTQGLVCSLYFNFLWRRYN